MLSRMETSKGLFCPSAILTNLSDWMRFGWHPGAFYGAPRNRSAVFAHAGDDH